MEEQREVINTKEILAHPNAYEEKTQTEIDKESSEDTNRPVASDPQDLAPDHDILQPKVGKVRSSTSRRPLYVIVHPTHLVVTQTFLYSSRGSPTFSISGIVHLRSKALAKTILKIYHAVNTSNRV